MWFSESDWWAGVLFVLAVVFVAGGVAGVLLFG